MQRCDMEIEGWTASQEDIDELEAKDLGFRCVGEAYLRAELQRNGRRRRCSYCNRLATSYMIGELAERIDEVFRINAIASVDSATSVEAPQRPPGQHPDHQGHTGQQQRMQGHR
jgi:hypothetical protein